MNVKTHIFLLATCCLLAACSVPLNQDGALAVIPYDKDSDGRIIVTCHIDGQDYRMAIDTAASISAIFSHPASPLPIDRIPGKTVKVHGLFANDAFPLLDIQQISVGNQHWKTPRLVELPGDPTVDRQFDGVLGLDFLDQYVMGVSVKEHVVRLYEPSYVNASGYQGWSVIPLRTEAIGKTGAVIYLFDAHIEGWRVTAVFDLGAGLNMMNWKAARKLGLLRIGPRKRDYVAGAVEGRSMIARHLATQVTTSNILWRNESFSISDFEIFEKFMQDNRAAAILGAGLFTQRDFLMDFTRERLLIRVTMPEVSQQ